MIRLTHILLASTMVPALLLAPVGGAFAQAPEQERPGAPRAEPHPPAGAPARGAPERAPHPAEAVPHAPGGAVHPPATRAAQPAAEAPPAKKEAVPTPQRVQAVPERVVPKKAPTPEHAPPTKAAAPEAPAHAAEPNRTVPPAARPTPNRATEAPARGAEPNRATEAPARGATPNRATEAPARGAEPNRATEAHPPAPAPAAAPANPNAQRTPGGQTAQPAQPNRQPTPAAAPANAARPGGPGAPGAAPQGQPPQNFGGGNNNQQRGGISPGGAAAVGAAAGFAGGFLAATAAQSLGQIRGERRESVEDGRTYIREPGRTIIEDGGQSYIVHDENDRFRQLGYDVRRERRGDDFADVVNRPDGTQIITYTTPDGRMLRRIRRGTDGREFVLIDNSYEGRVRSYRDDVIVLPPPPMRLPPDRYVVDYRDANAGLIYDTFIAPPLQAPPRRYTLDQIRYSPDIRRYVRSVDIDTINFDSGSWTVPGSATGKLEALADAIRRTIEKNPNTVFLVEGFTDATGNPTDNLSLSDRRAQSVAAILTKDFNVPPENLTTQGYGQQSLKENTQGPSATNRRVVVQNITPLLAAGGPPPR